MRLNHEDKQKSMERLWEITQKCYRGAELPERDFFENCVLAGTVFVVGFNQNPDGYALLNSTSFDDGRLLLRSMAVLPERRCKGMGQSLMGEVMNCGDNRDSNIYLHVRADNVAAQRLYLKNGFKVTKYLPKHYGQDGAGLEMERRYE